MGTIEHREQAVHKKHGPATTLLQEVPKLERMNTLHMGKNISK